MRPILLLILLLTALTACRSGAADERQKLITSIIEEDSQQLRTDVEYLASDALAGRDTGSEGERLAAEYIVKRMKGLLLSSGGTDGWLQPFDFDASPVLSPDNELIIAGRKYEMGTEVYPLNFSGSGNVRHSLIDLGYGISAPEIGHDDYANVGDLRGRIALISVSSPDGIYPTSKFSAYTGLRLRAELAQSKGARAVLFYSDDRSVQDPSRVMTERVEPMDIPVLFMTEPPQWKSAQALLLFSISRERLQGHNVIGHDYRGKERTIVIGAHYDHLGHGGNSSREKGSTAIHNGADDNASGVAAMLRLAHDLKQVDLDDNLLYIAFSGEERGLLGSAHFAAEPTVPIDQIDYMINLDMVGRLDSVERRVEVFGVGTSPSWTFIEELEVLGLRTTTSRSGTGPSDHTSFYKQDIPVLHFFSGLHEDYHRPTDDVERLNYQGIEDIVALIEHIVMEVDKVGELEFTPSDDPSTPKVMPIAVTGLRIAPSPTSTGVMVTAVAEGSAAERAGLLPGDLLIGMASYAIKAPQDYEETLASFERGMTVQIRFRRDEQAMEKILTFD